MIPDRWKTTAKKLKQPLNIVFHASRHPDTPWWVKAWILIVVAYALSPIDLIPDFIPVLGYLDDLLLVPAGLYIAMKLIPTHVLVDSREHVAENPASWLHITGGIIVVIVWGIIAGLVTVSIW